MALEFVPEVAEQKAARLSSKPIDKLDADASHYRIAENFIEVVTSKSGVKPAFCFGSLWRYVPSAKLWVESSLDAIAAAVGAEYQGLKLCRRGSDYRQIASLVSFICADDSFFSDAPAGIAAGSDFWTVTAEGDVVSESLSADHRQRLKTQSAPVFDTAASLFDKLLDNAFGIGESGMAQRELLQMAMGAACIRVLWRHRTVLMLYGPTSTGKSTLLEIFKSFFPADVVGATSPQNWESEYYVAGLAGKALNLVGELDPHTPLPGGAFKAVTGGDVVEGRHPTHRPFSFVCDAGHIFNANRLPPTRDKSDAFFRRWRIVEFKNPIPVGQENTRLAERIIAEEHGAVLGWLLDGAARLAKRGGLPETDEHVRLVQYWRAANNSALQFLLDPEYCTPDASHQMKAADLYDAYRQWANESGLKPLGRNGFYEAAEDGAGRFGMRLFVDVKNNTKMFSGVSLKK